MLRLYAYKKCSTCRKAESYLEKKKFPYEFIDITEAPPSKTLLKKILKASAEPLKKLFNTSGVLYREMGMKDKVSKMSESEALELLSKYGKLIKRPLAYDGEKSVIGFKEEKYAELKK